MLDPLTENFDACAPDMDTFETCSVSFPVFNTLSVAKDWVPTFTFPASSNEVVDIWGAPPVPVNVTEAAEIPLWVVKETDPL
jgi:hypothetical protein